MYGMIGYLYWHELWKDTTIPFLKVSAAVAQVLYDAMSIEFDEEL